MILTCALDSVLLVSYVEITISICGTSRMCRAISSPRATLCKIRKNKVMCEVMCVLFGCCWSVVCLDKNDRGFLCCCRRGDFACNKTWIFLFLNLYPLYYKSIRATC